jgi:hypothetical protein
LRQTRKFEEVSSRKKIKAAGPVSRILVDCFSQIIVVSGVNVQSYAGPKDSWSL